MLRDMACFLDFVDPGILLPHNTFQDLFPKLRLVFYGIFSISWLEVYSISHLQLSFLNFNSNLNLSISVTVDKKYFSERI